MKVIAIIADKVNDILTKYGNGEITAKQFHILFKDIVEHKGHPWKGKR